jgi:hypothetical protein
MSFHCQWDQAVKIDETSEQVVRATTYDEIYPAALEQQLVVDAESELELRRRGRPVAVI